MFDIRVPLCQLMGPVIFPRKTYLGKFPLEAGFIPIFRREYYMELSHPPFPLPRELNQVSFLATSLDV